MNKAAIIQNLKTVHSLFWNDAILLPNPNLSSNGKWSVAQNVVHITLVLSKLNTYLLLPKSFIKNNFGLNHSSVLSYESLIKVYQIELNRGVKTTSAYDPEKNLETDLLELIENGKELLAAFISNLQNWTEEDLDLYNCLHPILGKISIKEILYFTIYHVQHHHQIINRKP